jgi:membrane-bound lytic murein transglycosylase D
VYDEGLPPELEFLPIVESEYRVGAVSKSGAVGLWQFMLNSIGPHGLMVDEWEDQRRDFWASTEASLAKLRGNYEYLGDWLLALAAYNCGLGCTARAVRAAGTRDYWELSRLGYLPAETVHYVPKFLAVAYYASFAGRHGLENDWAPPSSWDRVPLDTPVDLEVLAKTADIPLELLRQGNAELRYSVTPPRNRPHLLKVPTDYADRVRSVLARPGTRLVDVTLHTVGSGDTLYDLARHYRIPTSMIQRYNPQTNPRTLRIGARLVIPLLQQVGPYRRDPGASVPFSGTYTVQSGDTLWSIARRYGVRVEDLANANELGVQSVLRTGTVLKVPSARAEEPDMGAYAQ